MSGHNKWSKIKNQKGASDAKKSKLFTKLVRLISVESQKANGNKLSPGLAAAIKLAHEANMPNDNIDRAIKKGTGADNANMETIVYEAYGPGSVAIIIEALTANRNKAVNDVKKILSNHNLELAGVGSVKWAFSYKEGKWEPNNPMELSDADLELLSKLVDELEDADEVQAVYTNAS